MQSKSEDVISRVVIRDAPPPKYGPGYAVTRPRRRRRMKLDPVIPSGNDHGKGSKILISSLFDEVLSKVPDSRPCDNFPPVSDEFLNSKFLNKLSDPQFEAIPTLSQAAREKAIWPVHSTEKRKRVIDIQSRLRRNDGGLVRCRLNSEGIDDVLLKSLSDVLPLNIYLQHMMLHDNSITDNGVKLLCKSLLAHPSIHSIWLGGNQISDLGVEYITELVGKNSNVREVNLSNRWPRKTWTEKEQLLHPHVTAIGAELFAKQLVRGCSLVSLTLAEQRVCDPGAIILFKALPKSKIRSLNLKQNNLTDGCTSIIQTCLSRNPVLEELILSGNLFKDIGAKNIATGLSKNKFLITLDLENNFIGDEGLEALADCLDRNLKLTTLATAGNEGENSDAERIASERKHNSELKPLMTLDSRVGSPEIRVGTGRSGRRPTPHAVREGFVERAPSREKVLDIRSARPSSSQASDLQSVEGSVAKDFGSLFSPSSPTAFAYNLSEGLHTIPNDEATRALTSSQSLSRPSTKGLVSRDGSLQDSPWRLLQSQGFDQARLGTGRRSADLGKTIGIPHIGSMGIMPVRSATTRHRDSGQHLLYLRVTTPNDPPNAKPYSVLQVAKDREAERKRVKLLRQDPEYKIKKKEKMEVVNVEPQRASRRPPPPEFWEEWRRKNRIRYGRGIDKTSGCTSTSIFERGPVNYDVDYLKHLALDAATGTKSGQSVDGSIKTQSIKTGGQALSMLRQRKKLLKSLSEAQEQQKKKNTDERERFFVLNDNKIAQVLVTEKTDFPILSKNTITQEKDLRSDNSDSDDDMKPKQVLVKSFNPRYQWGQRHLCKDGTMPVEAYMTKAVNDVRDMFGFNEREQELKRERDAEKERVRIAEETRKMRELQEAAAEKRRQEVVEEAKRLEEERVIEEARKIREEKALKRKQASLERAQKMQADKELKRQLYAQELERRSRLQEQQT